MGSAWVGPYGLFVTDLERSVRFFEALGLRNTGREQAHGARLATIENPDKGATLQLAQDRERSGSFDMGNAFWKLYVATNDIGRMFADAIAADGEVVSAPVRLDRWPMSIAFVSGPDGYLVELTQRHPWRDGDVHTHAWLDQCCVYVSDLERSIAFYEALGLQCTSRTDIPAHKEAIVEHPGRGGKIQLAQQLDNDAPIAMGSAMWKLSLITDRRPGGPPVVSDPDGYRVELTEGD